MKNTLIFKRSLEDQIAKVIGSEKVLLIFGPRQVGKTTLSKTLLTRHGDDSAYFDCEQMSVRSHFVLGQPEKLKELVGSKSLVVFDEAQTIENIGTILKVFVDTYQGTQIIATGSSSFDLANKINEPLTGRAFSFTLLPLSLEEVRSERAVSEPALHQLMQYGAYPAVVAAGDEEEKERQLQSIATSYLYKDIFTFERIKSPMHFEQLLKLLAHQVGSMVSLNELAEGVGVSRQTVEKYVRLLEQSYVIKRVHSFSHNKRNELRKSFKVYFIDTGVRNAVIGDMRAAAVRDDVGALFEQYVFHELLKRESRNVFGAPIQFWRTKKGHEVDFVVEHPDHIDAYECKWGNGDAPFREFTLLYPTAKTSVVRPTTLLEGGIVDNR